jgi:hypothetical protein
MSLIEFLSKAGLAKRGPINPVCRMQKVLNSQWKLCSSGQSLTHFIDALAIKRPETGGLDPTKSS